MIRYSGPVIDTHHHIWRRADVPWLRDPPIPRMFGDYFGLRCDYPVEQFMHDVVPEGVVKSVHVTANRGTKRARRDPVAAIGRRQTWLSACDHGAGRHDRP